MSNDKNTVRTMIYMSEEELNLITTAANIKYKNNGRKSIISTYFQDLLKREFAENVDFYNNIRKLYGIPLVETSVETKEDETTNTPSRNTEEIADEEISKETENLANNTSDEKTSETTEKLTDNPSDEGTNVNTDKT